jgi:cytochrome c peroxidase
MKHKSISLKTTAVLVAIIFLSGTIIPGGVALAQVAPPPGLFQTPLSQIPVPEPPNLLDFVKNKPAAIRLGKAFFWDMQVGSDGVQSCASCHFHAGVDNRRKNTINPGMRAAISDTTFQVKGPNETLEDDDFPFHKRDNPDFQASNVIHDFNDVVGSQGVTLHQFVSINTGSAVDNGTPVADTVFNLDKNPLNADPARNTRRVTARNTPTNINAVFNFNNFWDGRAHYAFNGVNPFGPLDTNAGVYSNATGTLVKQKIEIEEGSLASQATGPPLDDIEMSFGGRTFPELGRKMLSLTPLGKQMVHPKDSVLGSRSKAVVEQSGKMSGLPGLFRDPVTVLPRIDATYGQMIKDAFVDTWWNNTTGTVTVNTVGGPQAFTQMEANFSLFWGLAVQLYEATLVSGQTHFDRFLGGNQNAITPQQVTGMNLFFGAGKCSICHIGTEMTSASLSAAVFITNIDNGLIDQMPVAGGQDTIYDTGFNNTAVRRTTDDIGREGNSPIPNLLTGLMTPLSFCSMAELQAAGNLPFSSVVLPPQVPNNFPVSNHGAFKVPGMRNVELTGPYFHNGDSRTLEEVIDFYTRGGNFPAENNDLDFNITQIGALQNQPAKMAAMVAFMMSLTDERVRNESAPFDHPELFIPNGDNPGPDGLTRIPAKDDDGHAAPVFALTLNPLPGRTNKTNLLLSGTKEAAGTTVVVNVNGGPAIPATAINDTAWNATIDLAPGQNNITLTGTDVQGSVTLGATVTRFIADGSFFGGTVNISDALRALHIAVGLITPTLDDMIRGDVAPLVNGIPAPDDRIGVDDALLILKKAAGLVSF